MRKKAWLFLGCLILFSAAGALLRALELRTALDTSTMLMDMAPASILLLVLSAAALILMALLARKLDTEALPRRYNLCFGGVGSLVGNFIAIWIFAKYMDPVAGYKAAMVSMGVMSALSEMLG